MTVFDTNSTRSHWALAPRLATVFALAPALVAGCTEVPTTTDHTFDGFEATVANCSSFFVI